MDNEMNGSNEANHDLNERVPIQFEHVPNHGDRNQLQYYRAPILGYGWIGPFAGGLLGGLAAGALFGGYNGYGYGYGGYPYYSGYSYPPYYYGGYGYPYWRYP